MKRTRQGLISFAFRLCALLSLGILALSTAWAQSRSRPYIGYAYPAGGEQGTTFRVKLGGQRLDDIQGVTVSGPGVTARVVRYYRRMNPQERRLLRDQLKLLTAKSKRKNTREGSKKEMVKRIEHRLAEYVQKPACAALASLVFAEVTIAPQAEPGEREIRVATLRGLSNPLAFHVGQLPEHTRPAMRTAPIQVLGNEAAARRKRPAEEVEASVKIPMTLNGQIASGEINRYRFQARKGQRLVMSTLARQLIPYVADAVPGWFQPVLSLHDAKGKEIAFADDYRFRPDPVLLFEVPADGEYVLSITDAIHRGREDFLYRISIGELPWITSLFPLGARSGKETTPKLTGWNLGNATVGAPVSCADRGLHKVTAIGKPTLSNPVPFDIDTLPERSEAEPNNPLSAAQKVTLPVIINGRIHRVDDRDLFQFSGRSNDTVVVESRARRLDSPLDSFIKLTDTSGALIAFNDDREDLSSGTTTHQADSWFAARLPADGTYFVHISDTARKGGEAYGYRLRVSQPRPDFSLRVVPSSLALKKGSRGALTLYAQRRDGFNAPIKVTLKDPPPGFSAKPVTIPPGRTSVRLGVRAPNVPTAEPVRLSVIGTAKDGKRVITRNALPAEDRMQAFLWRQLVPAQELRALVYDPSYKPPPRRPLPPGPSVGNETNSVARADAAKPKSSKSQNARRLRELRLLYEEGLLTASFYNQKLAEL